MDSVSSPALVGVETVPGHTESQTGEWGGMREEASRIKLSATAATIDSASIAAKFTCRGGNCADSQHYKIKPLTVLHYRITSVVQKVLARRIIYFNLSRACIQWIRVYTCKTVYQIIYMSIMYQTIYINEHQFAMWKFLKVYCSLVKCAFTLAITT